MRLDSSGVTVLRELHENYGPSWTYLFIEPLENLRLLGRRAVLALLGIAVGCMAVVALLNIGHNARVQAMSVFKGMGSDLLVCSIQPPQGNYTNPPPAVTILNATLLHQTLPNIVSAAPIISMNMDVRLKAHTLNISVVGTNAELARVLDLDLSMGRFVSRYDAHNTYAVLGAKVQSEWRSAGISANVGDWVQIGDYLFEIIGVLKSKGSTPLVPVSPNEAIFLPVESMQRIVPNPQISAVVARHPDSRTLDSGALHLQQWLSTQFPGFDVNVQIPHQLIDGMAQQSRMFSWLLSGLGGISLLVGGIGVMNVMVMNISERRREIGVRMALGARPKDIARLFLLEAVVLATAGAFAGATLGLTASWIFVHYSGWQSFTLSAISLPLGIGSAIVTGLFFGLSPAINASRMSPIKALRDE
ncbi:ABC transporter permease [Rahnella aceris]|uniref:ABC transporter permease n=2 Tax=Rahnella TaxID=34037 RepID=UPI003B8A929F